jgi:uncharacterized Zn finger protein
MICPSCKKFNWPLKEITHHKLNVTHCDNCGTLVIEESSIRQVVAPKLLGEYHAIYSKKIREQV